MPAKEKDLSFIDLVNRLEDKIDRRFDKIEDKVDDIVKDSGANTVKLAENTAILDEHVKRSKLLEEQVHLQREELKIHEAASLGRATALETKQKELEENVEFMVKFPRLLAKLGTWLAAVSAIGAILWQLGTFIFSHVVK